MDADQFLRTIFDGCEGAVLICNAEDGFKGRRWKAGRRLQGTVYFCISTVKDPRPRDGVLSRQTQDLVQTYVIVLDDVGTKIDRTKLAGLLPPSYRLETSAGNEQWGYILDEGCDPARAAALIEALAVAGLTDMGARRADRIMRLPGAVNVPKGNFVARLLEWEPSRLYSFTDICVGLGVTPSDTPALRERPQLPAGMVDPLFQWLQEHGHVLDGPNPRGWWPVRCPQEHLHSGEVDHGTDYLPGMPGVFKCQHGHCTGFGRSRLADWVLAQDPGADLSVMPRAALEGLGRRLAGALGVVQASGTDVGAAGAGDAPGGLFEALRAQAAAGSMFGQLAPAQAAEIAAGEEAARTALDELIHVASESKYWEITAKCLLDNKAVHVRWNVVLGSLLERPKRVPMKVHEWLEQRPDLARASRIVHRLGEPLIADDCLNIAPAIPNRPSSDAEPEPWLDLVSFVCNDIARDRELVLDWMALVVADWSQKPGWHLLFKGEHGTGKNMALQPLVEHLKSAHWDKIGESDISGQFTTFLAKRLVQADELVHNTRGAMTPHDIYNRLKAWTARDADEIWINDKNTKRYTALNRSCWVVTSNAAIPLPLERGDRRFLVVETPRAPWPDEDYGEVDDWLKAGGNQAVVAWLYRRWDAMSEARRKVLYGRAPDSEAKQALICGSADGIEGAIRLAIEGEAGVQWPNLMQASDVLHELRHNTSFHLISDSLRKHVNLQRIGLAMRAAGAVKLFGGAPVRGTDRRQINLWCMRPSMVSMYEALGMGQAVIDRYKKEIRQTANWHSEQSAEHAD